MRKPVNNLGRTVHARVNIKPTPHDYKNWPMDQRKAFKQTRWARVAGLGVRGLETRARVLHELSRPKERLSVEHPSSYRQMLARMRRQNVHPEMEGHLEAAIRSAEITARQLESLRSMAQHQWNSARPADILAALIFPRRRPDDFREMKQWQAHSKNVRLLIDRLGPHFVIPTELKGVIFRTLPAQEPYDGLSLVSKRTVEGETMMFSLSIVGPAHSPPGQILAHEKYHDFERSEERMDFTLDNASNEKLRTMPVQDLKSGALNWFRQELSATLCESAVEPKPRYAVAGHRFMVRRMGFFARSRKRLKTAMRWTPELEEWWKKTEHKMLGLEQRVFRLAHENAQANRRSHGQERVAYWTIAGLVSTVPVRRLEKRLDQLAQHPLRLSDVSADPFANREARRRVIRTRAAGR